jgi:hypothetical protein
MAQSTTTTLTELIPAITEESRFWMTQASLFYPDTGRARQFLQWVDLEGKPGRSYSFNKYTAIEMGDAEEGAEYTTTETMETSGTAVTAGEKVVVVQITDPALDSTVLGRDKVIQDAGRQIGIAAASKVDKDVFATFASLGTSIVTTGNPITWSNWSNYIATLSKNKAPKPYASFMAPWGYHEFLGEASSPLVNAAASDATGRAIWQDYFAASIMGVEVYTHGDIPSANSGADWDGAFLSPWALGFVIKRRLKLETEREPRKRATNFVGVMEYGVGVIDATMGYRLLQDYS